MPTFIAIDIETTGLYPHPDSLIFCVAVNTGKSISLYEGKKDILKLKPILEDPTICKIAHNAKFDTFWLKRLYNINVANIWCTRLMEQVILGDNLPRSNKDEQLKKSLSSSLKYTLSRYGLAELENKELGASFATRNRNAPLSVTEKKYALNDVRYLLHLQAMQERRLISLDLMRVANLENKLVERVVSIMSAGIGFNKSIWLDIAKQNHLKYMELMKRLPPSVENWNSPQQVKKYFNSVGIPVESLTDIEKLQPAYNNKVLNTFIEARSFYKNVTTYGAGWLEDIEKGNTVDPDGRVRTDYEQILNTGRLASSHPNLNQTPRVTEHRTAFVPAKGNVFIIADYSSQEICIAAAASGEELWIKAILRGEDIHSLTASMVIPNWFELSEPSCTFPKKCKCPKHQEPREAAKITNFTILYGGGESNISEKTGMPIRDSRKIVYKFKKSVPKLTRWLDANAKKAVDTRISFSADPFKRRRTLRDPEDWMLKNIGKNNPIQSCGANMIKLAMVSLDKKWQIILTEHDKLVLEVPKSKAKAACKELKGIMEKAADYCTGVPGLVKAEPKIANSLKG